MDSKYINRELSWLEFNKRVLYEAIDRNNPLLERLKFIGIVSSNLDEFFMVRLAGLRDDSALTKDIYEKAVELMEKEHQYFDQVIIKEMEQAGIKRVYSSDLNNEQREYIREYFYGEIFPLLTPIAIEEDKPLPMLANLGTYCAFKIKKNQSEDDSKYSLCEIPRQLPRMITLPNETAYEFIMIENVIEVYAQELYQAYSIEDVAMMRISRAADLSYDEEKDQDFMEAMSEALRQRRRNYVIRLEIKGSGSMVNYFQKRLSLPNYKIFQNKTWFDLKTVSEIAFQPMFDHLKRPQWNPVEVSDFSDPENIWELINKKDILVHHPYQSFDAFIKFIKKASEDPDVLAIKQTLYRAASNSQVIQALEKAAQLGKQVTVLVELKARFDEERNIEWARRLEDAGANILYGITGLKTHTKACLVIRRNSDGIKRYVHLSTGNYNDKTASIYSDLGLFTCHSELASDISNLFNVMTGYSEPRQFSRIDIAPFHLRQKFQQLITREISRVRENKKGLIMLKMNSLVDKNIIDSLYHASREGVKIKLNVRGICCLKPGVKGLSENIEVTSIVDMFLEHSRIYYFHNGGNQEVFLSSADWMPRNFDKRIEIMFPILDDDIKLEVIDLLESYFKDNVKSWKLLPDMSYKKINGTANKLFRIQDELCQRAFKEQEQADKRRKRKIKPKKPIK